MNKRMILLGATGSVGSQALDVAAHLGYGVLALSAFRNAAKLEEQARRFQVPLVAMVDEVAARDLKARLADTGARVLSGEDGQLELLERAKGAQLVLNAVVGMAGLLPTLRAIDLGLDIALSNKETLVVAGELVMARAKEKGVAMLPVDSEHSAIFQCLQEQGAAAHTKKLWLTASGGPFFGQSRAQLQGVSAAQALKHPNWSMGAKISIDSATMMNKGLELIEAMHLFKLPEAAIGVVVQRQSIVHSMVEFCDGAVIAQLSMPDMALPIQHALTYPARLPGNTPAIDFVKLGKLSFEAPDEETFGCLKLARHAARLGGLAPAVLNGANEAAVALFLDGKLPFLGIEERVQSALESLPLTCERLTVEAVLAADAAARAHVFDKNEKAGEA